VRNFGLAERVCAVLQRLAHENVVTLMPNRGAMVANRLFERRAMWFAARRCGAGTVNGFLDAATRDDLKRIPVTWRARNPRGGHDRRTA